MKTFKIGSGKMVVTDPCYTIPTWCQGIIENVKNGVWSVDAETETNGRVKSFYCYNNEAYIKNSNIVYLAYKAPHLPFVVGVDSGQAGFFDLEHYRNDNSIGDSRLSTYITIEEDGDKFYSACCYCTTKDDNNHGEQFGTIPYGAISSSGYGDGSYICQGEKDPFTGEYIALVITFIEDDNDDNDEFQDEEFVEGNE